MDGHHLHAASGGILDGLVPHVLNERTRPRACALVVGVGQIDELGEAALIPLAVLIHHDLHEGVTEGAEALTRDAPPQRA